MTQVTLTKEEKIAKIAKEIARLTTKLYNIENDIVETRKAPKEVILPEIGATVVFAFGRKTANTDRAELIGRVVAVKSPVVVEGKRSVAQIKLAVGAGFDQTFVVIYPSQIIGEVSVDSSAE